MADLQTASSRRGTGRPTDRVEGEVRARIISEAARIFADSGYSGASIQEIVDAAGTTKPMVYYYFQNKQGLYEEIFRTYHADTLAAQAAVIAHKDMSTEEKLTQLVEIHFDRARTSPERARFMFAAHFGPRQEMPAVASLDQEDAFFLAIVALAKSGVDQGDLSGDPLLIAQALLGQILIHLTCHLSDNRPIPLTDDSATRVVQQLLQGVGTR
jgi:TetR/AcrR family transcriptional regulator